MHRGSRQRGHRRMEEEEYGAGGYEEGEQYAGDGDQYTAMQVTSHLSAFKLGLLVR